MGGEASGYASPMRWSHADHDITHTVTGYAVTRGAPC